MHIVIGNGESRKNFDLDLLLDHITYGCNAMYRDWAPTNLICIDNKMLHELVLLIIPSYINVGLEIFSYWILICIQF